jgi:hypothetical protein
MGKTWFIFDNVDTLKQTLLLQQGHKNMTQRVTKTKPKKVNTTGLPPVKRFLYSHIVRLHTFFFQDGKVS